MTVTFSFMFGKAAASAGRSTAASVPSTKRATVMTAPVFPALTKASALPSRTRRAATCTELSFLRRNAWEGESLMVITSVALTISMGRPRWPWRLSSCRTVASMPTSRIRTPSSRAARIAPSTSARGAWSPPMASTAMVVIYTPMGTQRAPNRKEGDGNLGCLGSGVNHFPTLIEAAMGTRIVGQLFLVAVRAFGQGQGRKEIVGTPLVLARMRVTAFWIRHCSSSIDRPLLERPKWKRYCSVLLLFEPVLLQTGQRGVGCMLFAAAFFVIQVGAAMRAEAAAIAAADDLHGKRQIHLLGQNIGEEQAVTFEERDFSVVQIQVEFLVHGHGSHGAVEEIEIAADFFDHGIQAARADQLDAGVQIAVDADLAFDQLGGGANFQRLDLVEFTGMEIERAGGIALPDAYLAQREFVYIQKHWLSPWL